MAGLLVRGKGGEAEILHVCQGESQHIHEEVKGCDALPGGTYMTLGPKAYV